MILRILYAQLFQGSMVFNPQDLAQLRDIHLPPPITWWPLAPGWYILATLIVLLSFMTIITFYRHHINNRAKRLALSTLSRYKHEHDPLINAKISELLKRVALAYYPREQVANLHGDAWIAFLNNTGKGVDFNLVREELLFSPYQATANANSDLLFEIAFRWIKKRGRPCLN